MNYPCNVPMNAQRSWTRSAIECYQIGCRCSVCLIKDICETECKMKEVVLTLVRKFGAPKKLDYEVI